MITLALIAVIFGLYIGASANYGENPLLRTLDKEGPYVFYKNDSIINVNYIRGNKKDGFYVDKQAYSTYSTIPSSCYFQIDKWAPFYTWWYSSRFGRFYNKFGEN